MNKRPDEPMPIQASAYDLLLWEDFDHPDGTAVGELGWTVDLGTPSIVEGEVRNVSTGTHAFWRPLTARPKFIEVDLRIANTLNDDFAPGLLLRYVDIDNHYMVRWIQRSTGNRLELQKKIAGRITIIASTAISEQPRSSYYKPYHLEVQDTGTDIVVTLPSHGDRTIQASDGGAKFSNQFSETLNIGFYNSNGAVKSIRVWPEVPNFNGTTHVEPAFGVQHYFAQVAYRHVGTHDRTYYGWISSKGMQQGIYYDHGTETFSEVYDLYYHALAVPRIHDVIQDHAMPSIFVSNAGTVFALIQQHTGLYPEKPFDLLRSTSPESLNAFDAPIEIGGNAGELYARFYQVANGDILLFNRNSSSAAGQWYLRRSSDDGLTWTAPTQIVDGMYIHIRQNPADPDHLIFVGNPNTRDSNDPDRPFGHIWRHCYVAESTDGAVTFKHVTATTGIALPMTSTNMEKAYDSGTGDNNEFFVTGCAVDAAGRPRVVAHETKPSQGQAVVYHNGSSWQKTTVVTHDGDLPGTTRPGGDVNQYDPHEVIISVGVGGIFEVQRWRTSDGGGTWAKTQDLTTNSAEHNFRIRYIDKSDPAADFDCIWHSGTQRGTLNGIWDRFEGVLVVNELLTSTTLRTDYAHDIGNQIDILRNNGS